MDRYLGARKLVADLVRDRQIEVRRSEAIGHDLATWSETLGHPPTGHELEAWLDEHAQVRELYASPKVLGDLVERYLTPPPPENVYAEARHPDLEALLADEPEPYMVYADWLQVQSDPLGELIALGVAATAGTEDAFARFEKYRKQHDERFFKKLTRQLAERVELSWRYGFVRSIEELGSAGRGTPLTPAATAVWEELLALRVCERVKSLSFRHALDPDREARIHAVASAAVEQLSFDTPGNLPKLLLSRPLRSVAVTSAGSVTLEPDVLPASLEKLELRVRGIVLESPVAIGVRELHLRTAFQPVGVLQRLQLPRLERLRIEPGVSYFDMFETFDGVTLPALRHLAIDDGVLDRSQFELLAGLPIVHQLESLALTNVELTDDRLQALVEARAEFPSLVELDVSFNELTADGLTRARELAANVISTRQGRSGNVAERRIRRWAGSRLAVAESIANPGAWQQAGRDGRVRWARYRGEVEYELYVYTDLALYGCSCPSRYQPCKHVVALALVAERTQFPEAPAPFEIE